MPFTVGALTVDLGLNKKAFEQGLNSAQSQAKAAGAKMGSFWQKIGLTRPATPITPPRNAAEALQREQDRIDKIRKGYAATFAGGTAAITGFVGAASPNAIAQLTGSLHLLSLEIGSALIPYVRLVSGAIQQFAFFIRDLPGPVKQVVAFGAVAVVVIAGAATAFIALTAALK